MPRSVSKGRAECESRSDIAEVDTLHGVVERGYDAMTEMNPTPCRSLR